MRLLVALKQKKNADTFLATIRALLERGHDVTLACQDRLDAHREAYLALVGSPERFHLATCPPQRMDAWRREAPLLRALRDCLRYQRPALRGAGKLQARTVNKLREDLHLAGDNEALAAALREIPDSQIAALDGVLALAEAQLPTDPLHDEFLRVQRPDVLLVSPLVHFGSAQADLVASAARLGIPVGMLLFSWDNLSTKGALHRVPDRMFVWNAQQRDEAGRLHDFPAERVVVVGAPRFDAFFGLEPAVSRERFVEPLGLPAEAPMLLYVCSSAFIASDEQAFVRTWLRALRASPDPALRRASVVVRPHPDIPLVEERAFGDRFAWPGSELRGRLARPFDDPLAVVLQTFGGTPQGLFECIWHSAAVVGLNTSAELEAAIVGRPVFTVLAGDDYADGQRTTPHFHYLTEAQGGIVRVAPTLDAHVEQLAAELRAPTDGAAVRGFAQTFLRPHGADRPVSPLLAEAIERAFTSTAPRPDAPVSPGTDEPDAAIHAATAAGAPSVPVPALDITLRVPPDGAGEPPRADKGTLRWLREHVQVGELVCDPHAGLGVYAVVAARQRGAPVVAFEAGYAAYGLLCENVRLNECDGLVLPVPLAVDAAEGLGQLKFPAGAAGSDRHALRVGLRSWQPRRVNREHRTELQPVCVTSLDEAWERYGWPLPAHVRAGDPATAAGAALAVLQGARRLLAGAQTRTVLVSTVLDDYAPCVTLLRDAGLREAERRDLSRSRVQALFVR